MSTERPPLSRGGRSRFGPRRGLALDFALALVAYGLFLARLEYPWQLAAPAGLAIGALSYLSRQTLLNLRRLYSPAPPEESSSEDADASGPTTSS
ncbi:MAG: hypothetical protein AAF725_07110 [Acidobacteriota bacterium]